MSFTKTILISLLSVTVVFLVWLFYPIAAPNIPLRVFLPADCVVTIELHEPAKWQEKLRGQKLREQIKSGNLSNILGDVAPEQIDEVEKYLSAGSNSWFGLRNCTAFSLGVTADKNVAAIFATDNIGAVIVKILSWFAPKTTINGIDCRYVKLPIGSDAKIYLSAIAKTRYFIVSTSSDLLTKYRLSAPPKINSLFYDAQHSAAEITLRVTPMLLKMLPAELGHYTNNGELFLWWNGNKIGGNFSASLPNISLPIKAAPAKAKNLLPAPNETGLFLNFAIAPENLAALAKNSLSPIKTFLPHDHLLTRNLCGSFFAQINPSLTRKDFFSAVSLWWEIDDVANAQNNFVNTINTLVKPKKADFFSALISAQLLNVNTNGEQTILQSPLSPEKLFINFSSAPQFNYACARLREPLPPMPTQFTTPSTILAGQLAWRYTPLFREMLTAFVHDHHSLPQWLPRSIVGNFTDFGNRLMIVANTLSMFNLFTATFTIDAPANEAANLQVTFDGEMRLFD